MGKSISYLTAIALLGAYIGVTVANEASIAGWLLMLFFINLAVIFRGIPKLSGFSFTTMIFGAVSLAMYYPQYFVQVGDFKLSKLIIPLLQIIMFGMGSELSLKELGSVLKTPKTI